MPDEDDSRLPIFPIEEFASSVRKTEIHDIENDDIATQDDLDLLKTLMWRHPERRFYLYFEKGKHLNALIEQAHHDGQISYTETQFRYYPHPRNKHDYVKLEAPFQFDWEAETAEYAPEHLRIELAMTHQERRRRDSVQVADDVRARLPQQRQPNKLEEFYRDHQLAFWVVGAILAVLGILLL